MGGVPAPVGLTATAAKSLFSRELHKIAVIAAQDFAAELRRKDSCHRQMVLSRSLCCRGGGVDGTEEQTTNQGR
jgi:hypothetical protein